MFSEDEWKGLPALEAIYQEIKTLSYNSYKETTSDTNTLLGRSPRVKSAL